MAKDSLTITLKGPELEMAQAMVDTGDANSPEDAVLRAIHIASAVDAETTAILNTWPEDARDQLLNSESSGIASPDAAERIRKMIEGLAAASERA